MAKVLCDTLGVKTPSAEAALVYDTLCRESSRNLTGITILGYDHSNVLGNDTGTCTNGVGVERRDHLDLTAMDKLESFFLGLCPSLEETSRNHTTLVKHNHVLEGDGRTGVSYGVVIETLDNVTRGKNVNPSRIGVYNHISRFFVCSINLASEIALHGLVKHLCDVLAKLYRGAPLDLNCLAILRNQSVIERRYTYVYNSKLAHTLFLRSSAFISALASLLLW